MKTPEKFMFKCLAFHALSWAFSPKKSLLLFMGKPRGFYNMKQHQNQQNITQYQPQVLDSNEVFREMKYSQ